MTVLSPASRPSQGGARRVALAGNPNSGKTTLFNALTGLRQKVANYPGVTVDKKVGILRLGDREIEVLDLPGAYSLDARSPDEEVSRDILLGRRADTPPPDLVRRPSPVAFAVRRTPLSPVVETAIAELAQTIQAVREISAPAALAQT